MPGDGHCSDSICKGKCWVSAADTAIDKWRAVAKGELEVCCAGSACIPETGRHKPVAPAVDAGIRELGVRAVPNRDVVWRAHDGGEDTLFVRRVARARVVNAKSIGVCLDAKRVREHLVRELLEDEGAPPVICRDGAFDI